MTVLKPGVGLAYAARALGTAERRAGEFPYQWIFPGPNSRNVNAWGNAAMPDSYDTAVVIASYEVPQGMRFSLRGYMFDCTNSAWEQGSGNIVFSMIVTGTGARDVEYISRVPFRRGTTEQPWPVDGRSEFVSNTTIQIVMIPIAVVPLGDEGGFGFGQIFGHEYPTGEAGEG